MEQSALGEDECAVNLWCFPHNWTAQVAVLHKEGIHWTKVLCDQMDRKELDRAVALYCENDAFAECVPMRIWDRDGKLALDYPK
ncbi:MAG TPA: hypothetical protein PK286_07180 [Devosia sp.]|nr:hypothetical protein [Devosia sp.]